MTGSRSKLERLPLPEDDPRQRCPDISLARETLGWAPKVQLREGLGKTIAYFDALLRGQARATADLAALDVRDLHRQIGESFAGAPPKTARSARPSRKRRAAG